MCGSWTLPFIAVPLAPSGKHVRQIALGVLGFSEGLRWNRSQLLLWKKGLALVVKTPAVCLDVVEPHKAGPAGVGLRERENRRGDTSIGAEDPAGQRNHTIQLLVLNEDAP